MRRSASFGSDINEFKGVRTENSSSQGQNLALTVFYVPSMLDSGSEFGVSEAGSAEPRPKSGLESNLTLIQIRSTQVLPIRAGKGATLHFIRETLFPTTLDRTVVRLFFFFVTLKPRVEWYNNLCALDTSPPRNRSPFLLSSGAPHSQPASARKGVVFRTLTLKPRPQSGPDCLVCAMLTRERCRRQ